MCVFVRFLERSCKSLKECIPVRSGRVAPAPDVGAPEEPGRPAVSVPPTTVHMENETGVAVTSVSGDVSMERFQSPVDSVHKQHEAAHAKKGSSLRQALAAAFQKLLRQKRGDTEQELPV